MTHQIDAAPRSAPPGITCLLIVVSLVVGFVAGAAFRSFDQDGEPSQVSAAPIIPAQTVVVVVELPPDPTATRTPIPTTEPTEGPTVDAHVDDCDRVTMTPDQPCRQPPFPTNTSVPMATCPVMPGDLCLPDPNNETTSRTEEG